MRQRCDQHSPSQPTPHLQRARLRDLDGIVDLAARSPSAGKTQGWHLVVLEGAETALFWDATLPAVKRDSFRWKRLLNAPVIALPLADSKAYIDRYAEPDKAQTGLGAGASAWPVRWR